MEGQEVLRENKGVAENQIENIGVKAEEARIATENEHNLSVIEALKHNKRVVLWCVFFAFSGVAW